MKNKPRYLTKSRFKLGMECATKLFYTKKPEYLDKKQVDPFLRALAEGGNQIGEIAKILFGHGYEITSVDYGVSLEETAAKLAETRSILYEAAFRHENLFVRADVVIKDKRTLKLMEVKSKTIESPSVEHLLTRNGKKVQSKWKAYLYDIAFQHHVVRHACPDLDVIPYLILVNKEAVANCNALNQRLRISPKGEVEVSEQLSAEDIGDLLCEVDVTDVIDVLLENHEREEGSFDELIQDLAEAYANDRLVSPEPGKKCRNCEFKLSTEAQQQGKWRDGFNECWKKSLGVDDAFLQQPNVLEIWNSRQLDNLIQGHRILLSELDSTDFGLSDDSQIPAGVDGLSTAERQWEQVRRRSKMDHTPFLDREGLMRESSGWSYPLHFIDFETSTAAVPFHNDRSPYETTAFQFSHHVYRDNGSIEHVGEYLNDEPGIFPNFDFVRNLKKELEADGGMIFRYAAHENTVLCHIAEQLEKSTEPDRGELIDWIKTITKKGSGNHEEWCGARNMIDLQRLIVKYFYSPWMKGSNSIKAVLPAVLNTSEYLQEKYTKPIYGTNMVPSLNFDNHTIFEIKEQKATDPYLDLPRIYEEEKIRNLEESGLVHNTVDGAAAMLAYVELQYPDLKADRRKELNQALRGYCEMDTLAMILIWEHLNNELTR